MFQRTPGGWEVPPFVNGHTHAEWNSASCLSRGDGYIPWLRRVLEAPRDPEVAASGIAATPAMMRRHGVGAILDHAASSAGASSAGASGTAVGREGLLGRAYREFLRELPESASDGAVGAPTEFPTPHAVHTVKTTALRLLAARARAGTPVPLSVHAGESAEERELYETGRGPLADILRERGFSAAHVASLAGQSPARLLDACGLLGPDTLMVHAIHLPDGDLDLIAQRGAMIVLCPISNRDMGTGFANDNGLAARQVEKMMDRGIRIALGTDSALSASTLSMIANARVLAESGLDPEKIAPMLWSAAEVGVSPPTAPLIFVPETDSSGAVSLMNLTI